MTTGVQCISCKWYAGKGYCKAFPDGIPDPIYYGEVDHTNPYPCDDGITFEPNKAG
jgi:hypothetical protein